MPEAVVFRHTTKYDLLMPDLHELNAELNKIPPEKVNEILCRQIREQAEQIEYLKTVINELTDYTGYLVERVKELKNGGL